MMSSRVVKRTKFRYVVLVLIAFLSALPILVFKGWPSLRQLAAAPPLTARDYPSIFLLDTRAVDGGNSDTTRSSSLCEQSAASLGWSLEGTYEQMLQECDRTGIRKGVDAKSFFTPQIEQQRRLVMLSHAIPKTAGTTVRNSIFKVIKGKCRGKYSHLKATHFGPGFENAEDLQQLLVNCSSQQTFAVNRPHQFKPLPNDIYIHVVPFRPYNEWSRSAMNQVVKWNYLKHKKTGNKDKLDAEICSFLQDKLSSSCEGYREFKHSSYTKPRLQKVLDQYHTPHEQSYFIMYDFRDAELVFNNLATQLGIPATSLTNGNEFHHDGTCNHTVLDQFHACFDDKLVQ